jgi:hypothetical protein
MKDICLDDEIDQASIDFFPASDPPAFWGREAIGPVSRGAMTDSERRTLPEGTGP